jgi:hypothetical protein
MTIEDTTDCGPDGKRFGGVEEVQGVQGVRGVAGGGFYRGARVEDGH